MALYAIGDLHLSLGAADKPMDVFGGRWEGYLDKLKEGFSVIRPEDTTVLLGDLSWAMELENAVDDFSFINGIPGRKLVLKGNHDYWWSTASKFDKFCEQHGFADMHALHNNCFFYEDVALCGTRGWFYEQQKQGTHDEKIFLRELGRLETSLRAAGDRQKLCFLHYPPIYYGYRCDQILELLQNYGVTDCYYGHLHGDSLRLAFCGRSHDVDFHLVSADYVNFKPKKIEFLHKNEK